jgi:hypothetical protein
MNIASVPQSRLAPSLLAVPRSARALRLEFKRNAVPYVLPLLAAVFYFNTVRTADGFPPVWTLRASAITDHMLFEFSAFAGGLAAWAGSREGRRKTVDLVAATPRAAWARLSIDLAAAFDPVTAEIAGLPGAPIGAKEVASVSGGQDVQSGISGNPRVFEFTAEHVGSMFGQFLGNPDPVGWREGFQQGLLDAFLTGRPPHAGPDAILLGPAQQVVEDALLTAVGSQPLSPSVTSAAITAAAHRFAALSAGARHAWLAAHLAALRAGTITVAQVP